MSDPNKSCTRKSCTTCKVTASSSEKKNEVKRRLKLTPQNIRDMHAAALETEIRRRIRRKIEEASTAIDEIVEEALNAPDDLPPAPMPDFSMATVSVPATANSDY